MLIYISIILVQSGIYIYGIISVNNSGKYFVFLNYSANLRLSMFAIVILLIAGAVVLYFVNEQEGARIAQELAD